MCKGCEIEGNRNAEDLKKTEWLEQEKTAGIQIMQVQEGSIHDWTFISRECGRVLSRKMIYSDLDFEKNCSGCSMGRGGGENQNTSYKAIVMVAA